MSSQHSMMTREVRTTERLVRQIHVEIDGSVVAGGTLTTNGVLMGQAHVKVTENGSGDYTLTLNVPGQRILGAQVTPITADTHCTVTRVSAAAVRVLQKNSSDVAVADADFFCWIAVSDAADAT